MVVNRAKIIRERGDPQPGFILSVCLPASSLGAELYAYPVPVATSAIVFNECLGIEG